MAAVTIRNLPDETHRALRLRAEKHGRSTEAEIRAILEAAVSPTKQLKIGTELAALSAQFQGVDIGVVRDPRPAEPASFE
jgi:plasmid stability protein